jgi:hypothetical protein
MRRILAGVVVLLLAWPALADDDKPKEKPKEPDKQTPAEQYQALVKEYADAQQSFFKEYRAAKTQEERQKLINEKQPKPDKYAAKFMELAEKNPKDPSAVDSLVWVVSNVNVSPNAKDNPKSKAIAILLRDHITSDRLVQVCQSLAFGLPDKDAEALLRGAMEKSPSADVQSEACLALAQLIGQKSMLANRLKDANMAKQYEQHFGKEFVADFLKLDTAKLDAENEALFKQFADKYMTKLKPERLEMLLQRLSFNPSKGTEMVMRRLLDDNAMGIKPEVRGRACIALAGMLKQRAEGLTDAEAKEAEKLNKESETLFERVIEKYADVKGNRGGILADEAKKQLFELRFLSKGKPAPEIEGEDLDGKQFKLSDYKGKVVLLDFWGNW